MGAGSCRASARPINEPGVMHLAPPSISTVSPQRGLLCREEDAAAADRALGARRRRVTLLVLAMALMGLADLALTLTFMTSVGMYEVNPIARFMVAVGGAGQLVRYKLFTIVLSGGILYLLRHHKTAERCAWLSCAGLLALSLHWSDYTRRVTDHPVPHGHFSDRWVYIAPD